MNKAVLSTEGRELRQIELSDEVFAREISDGAIYHAIRNELANKRVGTAKTKTRSEVKGTGAKPWRQKGTGRARVGTKTNPIWVGGGIAFGPRPRDYNYKMPRRMKRIAMASILSMKARDESLKVIEDFSIESGKTKDFVSIIKNIVPEEQTILILKDDDRLTKRAARNLPWLKYLSYSRLRAHDLFYAKHVVVLEGAALGLNEFYGSKEG
jgi:large subunit ribosomal protein L4